MGFLIRIGFWFSLVLLALPFGLGGEEEPAVGPIEALFAAKAAVSDLAGLCERKPEVCITGKAALDTIGARARESARIAMELIEEDESSAPPVAADEVPVLDATTSTGAVPIPSARVDNLPQG